jgi:hypothetical protein
MSDSGSDHEKDPAGSEDKAAVAHPEEEKEQDKEEEDGEQHEEGRPIKKAKI